jgi:hypothetical protein
LAEHLKGTAWEEHGFSRAIEVRSGLFEEKVGRYRAVKVDYEDTWGGHGFSRATTAAEKWTLEEYCR